MGGQECVICKKEGLKWLQKWRLFFGLPFRCTGCGSEYKYLNVTSTSSAFIRFVAAAIKNILAAFFIFLVLAVVLYWSKGYGLYIILSSLVFCLIWMFAVPVCYLDNDIRNRIIRKRRIVEQKKWDKTKSKRLHE